MAKYHQKSKVGGMQDEHVNEPESTDAEFDVTEFINEIKEEIHQSVDAIEILKAQFELCQAWHTLDKVSDEIRETETNITSLLEHEKEMDQDIAKYEQYFNLYEKFQVPIERTLFHIQDLESQYSYLQDIDAQIRKKFDIIKKFEKRRKSVNLAGKNEQLAKLVHTLAEMKEMIISIDEKMFHYEEEQIQSRQTVRHERDILDNNKTQMNILERSIKSMELKMRLKREEVAQKAKVQRKMTQLLEKTKEDSEQNVITCTEQLETSWMQHGQLVDKMKEVKENLEKAKGEVMRRDLILNELSLKEGDSGKSGIQNVTYIMNREMAENRSFAEALRSLAKEINMLECEQESLRGEIEIATNVINSA